jgi:DMSO/TMAO reductase YedYZ molybdopterin-dependent catalytic subunit
VADVRGHQIEDLPDDEASRTGPIRARRAFVAGLLGAAGATMTLLAAGGVTSRPGFLQLVADGITLFVPPGWFETLIGLLGLYAKGLVFTGVVCGTLVAGGLLNVLARPLFARRGVPATALALTVVSWLAAELVVMPVTGAGPFALTSAYEPTPLQLPLLVASIAYGALAAAMLGRIGSVPASVERPSDLIEPLGRRAFLARSAAALGALSLVGSIVLTLDRVRHAVEHAPSSPGKSVPPLLAGTEEGFGPTAAVTPVPDFYVTTKDIQPPVFDQAAWRLRVSGLVARPREFTLDEIQALPAVVGYRTLECISNVVTGYGDLIGNQRWRGVVVRDLLDLVGAASNASWVLWRCADGYTESLEMDVARADTTWLAYAMGDPPAALVPDHGAPARVLVAGRYGTKQPKWVTDLIVADHDEAGYWEQRHWDREAVVQTYCRIDFPLAYGDSDTVLIGRTIGVYGLAAAGDRGVSRVELSSDGGRTWADCELEPEGGPIGPLTWRRWRTSLRIDRVGDYNLVARATDGRGELQTSVVNPQLPSGATGWPQVKFSAVDVLPNYPTAPPAS